MCKGADIPMKKRFSLAIVISLSCVPCILSAYTDDTAQDRAVTEFTLKGLEKAGQPRECMVMRIAQERHGAIVVEKGILFTYAGRKVKKAKIAGDFTGWKTAMMTRGNNGIWYYFLGEYDKRASVRYKFNIDGIWISDPGNPEREDDGSGSYISIAQTASHGESKQVTYRILPDGYIEFRHYDAHASYITVAGDFNSWNPEHDIMMRGDDNIWRIRKRLAKGTHRYKFVIDGEWHVDVYNSESSSDGVGGIASKIQIK
jgi:1,4-alpha-glucan branching enzyme